MQTIEPIAFIKTDFNDKFGIPRQSGRGKALGEIVFCPKYNNPEAVKGIEQFNYLWLVFDFSENHRDNFSATVRPPRLGGNKRVGVFATRSPFRPNSIGLSSVKLLKVIDNNGIKSLLVEGVDMLNGTPIYDIKPYIPSSDCHTDATGGVYEEFTDYKLKVNVPESVAKKTDPKKLNLITDCIADDPRPSYQEDERVYKMDMCDLKVEFTVKNGVANVLDITSGKDKGV